MADIVAPSRIHGLPRVVIDVVQGGSNCNGSPLARTMMLKVGFGYAMLVVPESRLVSLQGI